MTKKLRVNAGKYKNRKLESPSFSGTRPTSDKVRESIFGTLISKYFVEGAAVLDLFCGTGALGIEALSRGAESAIFVDKNPECAAIARKNISFVTEPALVYNTDWQVAVRKLEGRKFDLIFLDPPYNAGILPSIMSDIIAKDLLSDEGCIVVEHSSDVCLQFDEACLTAYRKEYKTTTVTYFQKIVNGGNKNEMRISGHV